MTGWWAWQYVKGYESITVWLIWVGHSGTQKKHGSHFANRENPPPSDFPRALYKWVVFWGNQIVYTLQNDFRKLLPSPPQISLVANRMLRKKAIFKKKRLPLGGASPLITLSLPGSLFHLLVRVGKVIYYSILPETNSSPLKMDGWKMKFPLGFRLIFRGVGC